MPPLRNFPARFHDDENEDVESQGSSVITSDEDMVETAKPKWYHRGGKRSCRALISIRELNQRVFGKMDHKKSRRKIICQRALIVFGALAIFGAIAAVTSVSLGGALISPLNPPRVSSGLQNIVDNWEEPNSNGSWTFEWRDDFSRDVVPKNCHSHNDYWRSVPLYEALAAGCVSIEADIWLTNDNELLVSHSWESTKKERTLKSLYLDPLTNIYTNRNVSAASAGDRNVGLFDTDPNVPIILLIDFKSDGHETWPVLMEQLQPLREKGWITYFNGSNTIQGPLTIVGTGNAPFDMVQQNSTNRFIFFDAPLDDVANPIYTSENSYYASLEFKKATGKIWFNKLRPAQIEVLKRQIRAAEEKGLKARYWDTPAWPISLRDKVWFTLTELGVGMLNVDDLVSATRWNWNWCEVAGLTLCGNR